MRPLQNGGAAMQNCLHWAWAGPKNHDATMVTDADLILSGEPVPESDGCFCFGIELGINGFGRISWYCERVVGTVHDR
ncbi:hypothetical protein A2U01_0051270, partial [Trifolium medium]|nr:hypothetical protein [Trifolium medium]